MRFYNLVLKYPKSVIGIILLITLFFTWQMRHVKLNNSISELLPEGHSSVVQDLEVKYEFNSREMILIGIVDERGIFNPQTLQKVKDISDAVWKIAIVESADEGNLKTWSEKLNGRYRVKIESILTGGLTIADRSAVSNLLLEAKSDFAAPEFVSFLESLNLKLSPVSDVLSLASVENLTANEWGLRVDSPMEFVPQTEQELAELKEKVFGNEMFITGLVSQDSSGTLILAELAFYYDDHLELAHQVFQALEALAAPYRGPEQVLLAGVPMVNVYTSNYMGGDMARLMPIVILVLMAVMYISFRMLKGVLIPLAVVVAALIWTLGIMGILGRPITLVTSAMPVMLIAVAVADGIHLITEYQVMWRKLQDRDKAILATMQQLTGPVIITSLTDMAGFSSLAISSLRSIQDFGLFTAIGVFAALVFSLTFIPAALKLMKPPRFHFGEATFERSWITSGLQRLATFAIRRRRWVYAGTVALLALSIIAITRLNVGSTMVGYFKDDSKIFQASQVINEKFGGTEVLNIVVNTGRKNGLKEPEMLKKIASLQDTLETLRIIGYTSSLADYVKRINLVMNDNNPVFNRIPAKTERITVTDWVEKNGREFEVEVEEEISGREQIAQYLLLYENAGGDDLEKLADYDYSKANIVAQIRTDDTPKLLKVRQKAQNFVAVNFENDVGVYYAGCSNLCIVADTLIIPSQLKSLAFALVVVLLLLGLIFRSFRYGLLGLLPLVLTILFVFTLMSAFGVHLDAVTALVASIVLGVGIDYSVHFLSRYRKLRKEDKGFQETILEVFKTSGRAIVFNAFAVGIGFFVLMFSSFWPVIHIGWLVAANMLFSALLTLLLIPAVLASFTKKKVEIIVHK